MHSRLMKGSDLDFIIFKMKGNKDKIRTFCLYNDLDNSSTNIQGAYFLSKLTEAEKIILEPSHFAPTTFLLKGKSLRTAVITQHQVIFLNPSKSFDGNQNLAFEICPTFCLRQKRWIHKRLFYAIKGCQD